MPKDHLKIAKVLYRSPRLDTYVDAIAAIAKELPDIDEVCLVFPVGGRVRGIIDRIQAQLSSLASTEAYVLAARLRLTDSEEAITSRELYRTCALIDVTGIPKQDAIEVAASAIEENTARVGHFRWLETLQDGKTFRVGTHRHEYSDLLSGGAAGALRRNYIAKKHVLVTLGGLFLSVLIMTILKIVWPAVRIPDDFVNFFSLLIGAAGLYFAAVSLRAR